MTGPTLSQILDPPRPPSNPQERFQHQHPHPNQRQQHQHQHQQPPRASFPPQPRDANPMGAAPTNNSFNHPSQTASPPTPTSSNQFSTSPASANRQNHEASNLYACRDCGRSYSRPEHLVRHVQTHTLGRRFVCDICQKSFARKDLLRRHVANHANDTPAKRRKLASSPGQGRVSYACRACAAARVKCDEAKPCKRCVNRNITCVSSQAGSAAAMHLVSLSSKAHSAEAQVNAAPTSYVADSRASSPPGTYNAESHPEESVTSNLPTAKRTPTSQSTPLRPDEHQLPTPETAMPETAPMVMFPQPTGYLQEPIHDGNRMPFFDFLRDVLYDQPFDSAKPVDPQGVAMLDFCNDTSLELTDMDFGLLDYWNLDPVADGNAPRQHLNTSSLPETANEISQIRQSLVKVWTESPWRWQPRNIDTGYGLLGEVPVSSDTQNIKIKGNERISSERLDLPCRDKVLAITLGACKPTNTTHRVAASFPSVEVLDTMIHIFLAEHSCQVSNWIHIPTLKFNEQWPEWIAGATAGGAVATSISTLRKFGYSVQEAIRITLINRFEEDNRAIKDLGLVQTYVLWEDISLWSGNRRKMEIAECHLAIPVTMMRYRGKFQRSYYPPIDVQPEDDGEELEAKWKAWVEKEQWKRLIFHCYLREAQVSMIALTNPCLTYSELTLPFPEARELWFAKSAQEWKAHYLQRNVSQSKRPPSVGDIFRDVHLLRANEGRLDIQFAISIYLHGFWAMILEYRQMCSIHRSRSYTTNLGNTSTLLLSSRHQELVKELQNFQLIASDWAAVSPQEHMVLNILLMNLHISIDDLQLFSGKEGEEQARRIYPILQQWVGSPDSRSAAWYAGQVLRYAKMFPQNHIKGFYAVAIHHAALALWTYGVIGRANRRAPFAAQSSYDSIPLDGTDSLAVQRFIGFEQGQPVIRGPEGGRKPSHESPLRDTRACMEIVQDILQCNASLGKKAMPPIVENLCGMIKQLGHAAWAVGLG